MYQRQYPLQVAQRLWIQKGHQGTIKEATSVLATIEDAAEREAEFLDQKRQGRNKKNHKTKNDNNNDKNQEVDSK